MKKVLAIVIMIFMLTSTAQAASLGKKLLIGGALLGAGALVGHAMTKKDVPITPTQIQTSNDVIMCKSPDGVRCTHDFMLISKEEFMKLAGYTKIVKLSAMIDRDYQYIVMEVTK